MSKGALAVLAISMMTAGGAAAIGAQVFAQTTTTAVSPTTSPSPVVTTQAQDTKESLNDPQDENVALPVGGLTEAQARAAITAKYPSVAIKHIELEDINGTVIYGVKLADKTEVTVDAKTGVVTQEAADQEGIEHANDNHSGNDLNEAPGTETNDGPDSNDAETAD